MFQQQLAAHEFTGHRSGRLCNQVAAKEITPAANAANGLAAESTSEEINLTNAIYEKAATEVEISGGPRAVHVTLCSMMTTSNI
jgi:hypothetical protein